MRVEDLHSYCQDEIKRLRARVAEFDRNIEAMRQTRAAMIGGIETYEDILKQFPAPPEPTPDQPDAGAEQASTSPDE